jgi:transcriptional regulator with XRE-family HTH domain
MRRFGEKLRTLRKRHHLTQRDVAHELEVQHGFVHKLETGQKRPNVEHILKLARLFGVTTDQLLMDELEVE